jgi:hypothetical protein
MFGLEKSAKKITVKICMRYLLGEWKISVKVHFYRKPTPPVFQVISFYIMDSSHHFAPFKVFFTGCKSAIFNPRVKYLLKFYKKNDNTVRDAKPSEFNV